MMMSVAEEEEKLNDRLKAAGLWEDGLSLDEKQTLCNLLVESCTYALNEEEQRRQLQLNEGKKDPHSQNNDESRQNDRPQHVIQEPSAAAAPPADAEEDIQEIGSNEEVIVSGTSQSSQCKETVTTQKPVPNHAPSPKALFQLTDDEDSSGSLIPTSIDIDVTFTSSQKKCHTSTAACIQNSKEEPPGSKTVQSLPNNEGVKSDVTPRESAVELSETLSDDLDLEASQSLLGEAKNEVESEASFHCNLVLEQSKNTSAGEEDLDELQVGHQSGNTPSTSSATTSNENKPTDSLHVQSTTSENNKENDREKSKMPIVDLRNRMPERRIIELHSKRIDDIRFNSPVEFASADEETRVKIYKEILESLAKVSLALASSRRKPNVAMPWKKVIKLLPCKPAEGKTLSSCTSYSLRQRRGFKNRRDVIPDVFEEEMNELPEVEQIVKGKDDDWLPSSRAKKRRRGNISGQQNVPNSEIAQIEYQSSDDEAFLSLPGKRKFQRRAQKIPVVNGSVVPRLREDQGPSQHSVSSALPHLNIDKALLASCGKKYGSVLEKTSKHDSVIKMAVLQADGEDSSSDVDVVEVDEPAAKVRAAMRTSVKSTPSSSTIGSPQLPLINRIPVLSGTSLSSQNNSTLLQRNEPNIDSADKPRGSVVRNLLNNSSAFIFDKLKNSLGGGGGNSGGAEEPPSSPQDEDVTIRPAPVKLRGEKRTLIAGSPSSAPKMPCKSKNGCASSRCSREESPSAAQVRLAERCEGQSHAASESVSDRHNMVLEMAERRRFLEESKRGGRGVKTKPVPDEGPASFQCPLCQVFFTRARIESHAAECDGVSPMMTTRQQRKPQQQEDHQKPSCSSGPAQANKCPRGVYGITTIDSESEDPESDRVALSARAGLGADHSSVASPYATQVRARSAAGGGAAKGNLDRRQQLLVDSDDDDLLPLDDPGKSATKLTHNNGLRRNK